MQLERWQYLTHHGFTLRGFHSPPSGKPLLHMLHGNGFSSLMYQPMLQVLSQHFDLFLSDAQGHGDSDHGGVFVDDMVCVVATMSHSPMTTKRENTWVC